MIDGVCVCACVCVWVCGCVWVYGYVCVCTCVCVHARACTSQLGPGIYPLRRQRLLNDKGSQLTFDVLCYLYREKIILRPLHVFYL